MKRSPTFFGIYLVTSKKVGDFFKFSYRTLKYRSFVDFYSFFDNFLLWGDCLVYLEIFLLEFSISVHCVVYAAAAGTYTVFFLENLFGI